MVVLAELAWVKVEPAWVLAELEWVLVEPALVQEHTYSVLGLALLYLGS